MEVGFMGTGRIESGVIIVRLSDEQLVSSAITTAGAGFSSQIGEELTDFVFILNSTPAVRTFVQMGESHTRAKRQ
ncbi:SH3 domain-containing protein [Aspergillus sp. HF37]|nr:SH3 domain-containing protein [Aspergillus sp. HF37]